MWGKNRVANQLRFLVYTTPHDSTYKYIKEYSQDAPCTQGDQYYFQMTKKKAEPASQGAFASKYCFFIEAKHIDNAYVLLPEIANRNRAGDSPSHLVSTFFTVKDVNKQRVPIQPEPPTHLWYTSAHCSGIGGE